MNWVYLSPHLDDAALSCGGIIWEQVQRGDRVEIWTICAGDPPAVPPTGLVAELHDRWQTGVQAVAERRAEDAAACAELGAAFRHLDVLDCIYRTLPGSGEPVVRVNDDLFTPLQPGEAYLIDEVAARLQTIRPRARLVCPLTLGGHMDHRLVRAAAERLGRCLWYYADYPYAAEHPEALAAALLPSWKAARFRLSPDGLSAWQNSIAAYRSQISTWWASRAELDAAIAAYAASGGGRQLWHPTLPTNCTF